MLYNYQQRSDRRARGECYIPDYTKLTRIERQHILEGGHTNAPIEELSMVAFASGFLTIIFSLCLPGAWHYAGETGNQLTQFGWYAVCALLGALAFLFGVMAIGLPFVIWEEVRINRAQPQVRVYDNRDLAWKTLKKAIDSHSGFFAFRLAIKRQNALGQQLAGFANAYLEIIQDAVLAWDETGDKRVMAKIDELANQAAIAIHYAIQAEERKAKQNHILVKTPSQDKQLLDNITQEGKRAEEEFLKEQEDMLRELKITDTLTLTDTLAAGKFDTTAT